MSKSWAVVAVYAGVVFGVVAQAGYEHYRQLRPGEVRSTVGADRVVHRVGHASGAFVLAHDAAGRADCDICRAPARR